MKDWGYDCPQKSGFKVEETGCRFSSFVQVFAVKCEFLSVPFPVPKVGGELGRVIKYVLLMMII